MLTEYASGVIDAITYMAVEEPSAVGIPEPVFCSCRNRKCPVLHIVIETESERIVSSLYIEAPFWDRT